MMKAVILRIPIQRATPSFNDEHRRIADPSATGTPPLLDEERRQKCYENIFKVEDAGRLVYIYNSLIWFYEYVYKI